MQNLTTQNSTAQIGEVIRTHRKMKGITQEEMTKRLGVTAPAVNKWENGISLPDITMLAPIARLLDITVDTLLSFHEELTDEEIKAFVIEVDEKFKTESYDDVFKWTKKIIERYPNCERLIWELAQILDARRLFTDVPNSESYDDYINRCYIRALDSKDEQTRTLAAGSLFHFYLRKEWYEKAEEYLTYFSDQDPDRKRKQALIYSKTNRVDEAYRLYEELLFSDYQMTNLVLQGIYMLAMEENDFARAHAIVEKKRKLANVFDMGEYHEISMELDLVVAEKDVEKTIDIMEKMIASVDTIMDFYQSPLYEHMTFKPLREEFLAELRENLLQGFRDEETFAFLKDHARWQQLVK